MNKPEPLNMHIPNLADEKYARLAGLFPNAITEIAKQKPYYAVFRDSSFSNDSAMVNFEQVFATYSPATIRRVL